MATPIVCFIHSSNMEIRGTEILDEILAYMKKHNFFEVIDRLIINNVGIELDINEYTLINPKIMVLNHSRKTELYENCTLRLLHFYSLMNPGHKVFYLHTKGVGYTLDHAFYQGVKDWVDYLLYCLVEQAASCVGLLDYVDVVGCNYRPAVICHDPDHFSGNFWWATTNYIRTLTVAHLSIKYDAEFWLFRNYPTFISIHRSPYWHYGLLYKRKEYEQPVKDYLRNLLDMFEKWPHQPILYGIEESYKDITDLCHRQYASNGKLEICAGYQERISLFGDPRISKIERLQKISEPAAPFESLYKYLSETDKINVEKEPHIRIGNVKFTWHTQVRLPLTHPSSIVSRPSFNPKVVCFIHSTNIRIRGPEILDDLIQKLESSGFMDIVDNVFINNIGYELDVHRYANSKIVLTNHSHDTELYENCTLRMLHFFASLYPDSKILYLHTKGVGYTHDHPFFHGIQDWVNYMLYCLVHSAPACLKLLNSVDVVGCNYRHAKYFENPDHYSGNYWWTTANYMRKMSIISLMNKYDAEFWLFKGKPAFVNIYSCSFGHYQNRFPSDMYENIVNENLNQLQYIVRNISHLPIYYGTEDTFIDVTDVCHNTLVHDGILEIPVGDMERNVIFGDPCPGITKHVRIGTMLFPFTINIRLRM